MAGGMTEGRQGEDGGCRDGTHVAKGDLYPELTGASVIHAPALLLAFFPATTISFRVNAYRRALKSNGEALTRRLTLPRDKNVLLSASSEALLAQCGLILAA